MSLVCSVIFIHHAFNANILDKDYAFSDGEILMVDNAVRTHFEPYERHFKEIGFTENTIKNIYNALTSRQLRCLFLRSFYVLLMYRLDCLMK